MRIKFYLVLFILGVIVVLSNSLFYFPAYSQQADLFITQGIASGDVTDHSAIIWARSSTGSQMHVQYTNNSHFSSSDLQKTIPVNQTTDFTGHAKLDGLNSDTAYHYRVWFSSGTLVSDYLEGNFTTAPDPLSERDIEFVIGGDLGGSKQCRHLDIGYPIFSVIKTLSLDFFIFNGDQIYADNTCPLEGPGPFLKERGYFNDYPGWRNIPGDFLTVNDYNWTAVDWRNKTQLHDIYVKHWEYNRNDSHLQSLLSNTSMYSQADDHEVIDDYGGQWDYYINMNRQGYPNLVETGVGVFFNFSPIDRNKEEPNRIYRSFNWGKDLDLFLLDAHSYRSRSELADTPQNNKTLLGKEQLEWLKEGLENSNATWKVISSPVPITIPNCFNNKLGCDNWATNSSTYNRTFVREREQFLNFLDNKNITNVVFIATDVHFAANVKYEDNPNNDKDNLILYEIVTGPLNTWTRNITNPTDPTINAYYLYNESAIFNFGYINIQRLPDGKVHLISEVIDSNGRIRPNSILNLIAQDNTELNIAPKTVASTNASATLQ